MVATLHPTEKGQRRQKGKNMIDFINEYLPTILTAIIGVLSAFCSYIVARLQTRKVREQNKLLKTDLQKAKEALVACKCPHCKKEVFLRDLSFYLPDGSSDDDLNGQAD